jgi:hypothetical protein
MNPLDLVVVAVKLSHFKVFELETDVIRSPYFRTPAKILSLPLLRPSPVAEEER